jgi:DNA-binding MarR family transcriptional regulator
MKTVSRSRAHSVKTVAMKNQPTDLEASAQGDRPNGNAPIGSLLRRVYQRNQSIWQALCIDDQVTSVQANALYVLAQMGPCSLTKLGAGAAMDPATTRGVVERLSRRGMIRLSGDEADRRKVIVDIEDSGRAFLKAMEPILDRIADETLRPLNVAERVALEYLLRTIADAEEG